MVNRFHKASSAEQFKGNLVCPFSCPFLVSKITSLNRNAFIIFIVNMSVDHSTSIESEGEEKTMIVRDWREGGENIDT